MATSPRPSVPTPTYAALLVGIALALGGTRLDGFVSGMLQGAGIALILLSVAVMGAFLRRPRETRRDPATGLWLPSRDEKRDDQP